jgi:hypothetical protein
MCSCCAVRSTEETDKIFANNNEVEVHIAVSVSWFYKLCYHAVLQIGIDISDKSPASIFREEEIYIENQRQQVTLETMVHTYKTTWGHIPVKYNLVKATVY